MIRLHELHELQPKVVCLGTHPGIIQSILDYDYLSGKTAPSIVAIIAKGRKQERYFWGESEVNVPVLASLDELGDTANHINCALNVQSARRVLSSTQEALRTLPQLKMVTIFAEQTPERHSLLLAKQAHKQDVLIVGPASVGVLVPGALKLGAIGGTQHPQIVAANILKGGDTAVVSTSGGMVNELIHTVTGSGLGVSFALALGGDRFPITTPADAFLMAEADARTTRIVYFGELGGNDEYEIAELLRTKKITKQVVAYIAGTVAELFETPPQFGHAKAMAQTTDETAAAKKALLRGVGVQVCDSLSELSPWLAQFAQDSSRELSQNNSRYIGERRKRLIMSHVSGDVGGDVHLLGKELRATVEEHTLAGLVLSMFLGKPVKEQKVVGFTDYVLRLLVDHGPHVSGAVNTIVAARAGKDLVSSLAAGLLTIGPRFGGAINESARAWLDGAQSGQTAKDFVDSYTKQGGIVPGIGHKKYRIDLPDPRVDALRIFAGNSNDDRYLNFALSVQAVTTAKKGNLILNVDGAIAAILLDLLESELKLSHKELYGLIDAEFFNAFFVISRSIGFTAHYIDQRRHDEGLLRLSDQEITYVKQASHE